MEALVEKLCQRFKLSTEERQWRDIAYCLSLFSYNERSLRKLIENLDCYKDKLHCSGVMESFNTLMNNTAKMAKNEIKVRSKKLDVIFGKLKNIIKIITFRYFHGVLIY